MSAQVTFAMEVYAAPPRKGEISGGNTARGRHLVKLRSFVPSVPEIGRETSQRLVGKECKDLILPNRSAQPPTELVESLRVLLRGVKGSVAALAGVHPRAISLEERTAVELVSAAFRDDFDLCTAVPPIFSIIAIADDLDFLD